jgi:Protein of unknown function (DUF998)
MTAPASGVAALSVPRTSPSDRRIRPLAIVGIAGALTAVVVIGALHVLPGAARVDPVRRTISEYALTDDGWAFNLGVVALALGSLAILVALVRARLTTAFSPGVLLGAAWAAALLVIVLFPKHNWAVGPSTNGSIHRAASVVAFLCLPVAVILLTRGFRARRGRADRTASNWASSNRASSNRASSNRASSNRDGASRTTASPVAARTAGWLAIASLAWFAIILGALALSPLTGTPWFRAIPLGLVERGLVICEVLAVTALGVWALTASRPTPNPPPASPARTAPTS